MLKISEKRPFFRADMAGLGIYHMGGYGRIGVYRVKTQGTLLKRIHDIPSMKDPRLPVFRFNTKLYGGFGPRM